jgi:hypothetical protein
MGRNVHVLFVHGVGQHSPLSSLLRPYQALRSDIRSREAPTVGEDPIPDWRLDEFDDTGPPRYLRLTPRYPGLQPGPDSVYLYEVNYAALAGVIRENQPLDVTQLSVGFDLAANVALQRLRKLLKTTRPRPQVLKDAAIAQQVPKLASVLVASTVPILGIPALVFRAFTRNLVGAFVRFFEDVATFALDKNGEQLISKHVDRTVAAIVGSPRFQRAIGGKPGDTFVIVAHSLGSLVIHNFLVRRWGDDGPEVPKRLITYGSPIGLVCWVWRFLDFPGLQFTTDPDKRTGDEYFCWTPQPAPTNPLPQVQWLNVVNFLDPIATAFPPTYVNLSMQPREIAAALRGGAPTHCYMAGGALLSAHTGYMEDRKEFLELLARSIEIRPRLPISRTLRDSNAHWRRMRNFLFFARWVLLAIGLVLLCCYFALVSWYSGASTPWVVMPLYVWPAVTIGYLAFFQKLFFGAPTKRSRPETVRSLPRWRLATLPYRLRLAIHQPRVAEHVKSILPGLIRPPLSLMPTLFAMSIPVLWLSLHKQGPDFISFVKTGPYYKLPLLLGVFMVYAITFALSEFARHWRRVLKIVT